MTREELLSIAKPILFNTEMVQAILEGRKTVTRRVIKRDISNQFDCEADGTAIAYIDQATGDSYKPWEVCRFKTGDYLYVRETWHKYIKRVGKGESCHLAEFYGYKASIANSEDAHEPWKPSIHMPKEAARIFLKVKNVRVERLQDITEEQVLAEGIYPSNCRECIGKMGCDLCPDEGYYEIDAFQYLWNSTIKKADLDKYGWEANPWVWVIEFEKVEV